ncbi:MAG: TetR family transcriptional regulator [Candidatus Dormibacteria bacterium]
MGHRVGLTRQVILGAALEHFYAQGYEATTLQQLADQLGVTKAALYYHYRTKDALLEDVVGHWLDATLERTRRMQPATGPEMRREILSEFLRMLLDEQMVVGFLASDVSAINRPGVGERLDEMRARMSRLIADPKAGMDGQVRAAAAIGALWQPLLVLRHIRLEDFQETLVEAACRVLAA